MPNDQQPNPQQSQPSEEHERQIVKWASKEEFGGTVVCKDLINWFAEQLLRRDGIEHKITSDFAHEFLHRHPDLEKQLAAPLPPEREGPYSWKPKFKAASARLQAMMAQDRTRASFGDSPPPPRQPADFPDGDIIYHCNSRYIVRHGSTVTKITTCNHGSGHRLSQRSDSTTLYQGAYHHSCAGGC